MPRTDGQVTDGQVTDGPDLDPAEVARARDLAVRRLAAVPRTRAQLEAALLARQVTPGVAAAVLDSLQDAGAVDDAAFARGWVDSRRRSRSLSRSRLERELAARGIPEDAAQDALAGLDQDADRGAATDLARQWVRRRCEGGVLVEDRDRARLFAHLARRGYGPGLVTDVVHEVGG